MAGKFLSMDEAASQLGISAEHLRELTQKYEVNGLRDGASFKYKPEEIERAKAKLFPSKDDVSDSGDLTDLPIDLVDDSGDDIVLLSEVELGESGPGTSATVIGPPGGRGAQEGSDIAIFAKESDLQLGKPTPQKPGSDLNLGGSSDLGLDLGSALNLSPPAAAPKKAESELNFNLATDDDDDLVLSGPGSSDITLSPGDSGISLGSPADSGLSLDEPLNLGAGASGNDFDLAGSELNMGGKGADLKADDEFLLTPSDEGAEDDSDASGSQVIVIDSDSADFTEEGGMLEEDTTATLEPVGAMATDSYGLGGGVAAAGVVPMVREASYSGLQIVSLSFCMLFLVLSGMMMIDITRNMWAWNNEMSVNSALMDAILGIFG